MSTYYKSAIYAIQIFLGAAICWYGLILAGVDNPIWAVITVIIVSDPDISATRNQAKMRVINTIAGCCFGLAGLALFGFSPLVCLLTIGVTTFVITAIKGYPVNWRLAPATVVILMNAGMQGVDRYGEILLAFRRAWEIGIGCMVALGLSLFYTYVVGPVLVKTPKEGDGD